MDNVSEFLKELKIVATRYHHQTDYFREAHKLLKKYDIVKDFKRPMVTFRDFCNYLTRNATQPRIIISPKEDPVLLYFDVDDRRPFDTWDFCQRSFKTYIRRSPMSVPTYEGAIKFDMGVSASGLLYVKDRCRIIDKKCETFPDDFMDSDYINSDEVLNKANPVLRDAIEIVCSRIIAY